VSKKGVGIIVALDYPDAAPALELAARLDPGRCKLKVGKELFTSAGPDLVRRLAGDGYGVFLDLKYHDIPHTVARACEAAAGLGVWMLNVHAGGGRAMLEAAREAVDRTASRPLLIGVTVLTSLGREDLAALGIDEAPAQRVRRLARLAEQAGLDGVVCSPQEIAVLRRQAGPDFCLVTPGIRPAGSDRDDQRRVMTPGEAAALGANFLVIGRPITKADDPLAALSAIEEEIAVASR